MRCGLLGREAASLPLLVFNHLAESSLRLRGILILAVLITFLDRVQNPLDCATSGRIFANFELAG